MSGAYFERVDETRFRPSEHTTGGWDTAELHVSPLAGLIVHAIDGWLRDRGTPRMPLARLSLDILGRLPNDVCEVRIENLRPGRTIELLEATLLIGDRAVVRARAWLVASLDTRSVAGGADPALPSPDDQPEWPVSSVWPGGFIASLDVRSIGEPRPGRATAWVTSRVELVGGEQASELASYVALVDTVNGLAARESPEAWMYPNVDLTIHLHRQPEGRWVGIDSTQIYGPAGHGLTSTVLHDMSGAVGAAQQILTVRPQGG